MRFIKSIFFFLFVLSSCQKRENYADIQVIGHAGMGLEMSNSIFHDNSLEAIELALKMPGSNGVEIDVQQDLDGELWLFHDETLDVATNSTGCISSKTSEELENINYLSFHKEKLLKLSELNLDTYDKQKIFLDLRFWKACSESYVNPQILKTALLNLNIQDFENVYLLIPSESFLTIFENEFNVLYSNDNYTHCLSVLSQDTLIQGLVIRNNNVNFDQVKTIQSSHRNVFIFEMRSPKGIKLALSKRPDGIITDDLRATIIQRRTTKR